VEESSSAALGLIGRPPQTGLRLASVMPPSNVYVSATHSLTTPWNHSLTTPWNHSLEPWPSTNVHCVLSRPPRNEIGQGQCQCHARVIERADPPSLCCP